MAFPGVSAPVPGLKAPTLAEFKKGPVVDLTSTNWAKNGYTNHYLSYSWRFTKNGQAMTPVVVTGDGNARIEHHKGVLKEHFDAAVGDVAAAKNGWVITPRVDPPRAKAAPKKGKK